MCSIFILFSDSSPIEQNYNSLEFLVNNTHPKGRECYNLSVDFDDNKICEHFNCSSNIKILSSLESADNTSHVNVNGSMAVVMIEAPDKCECASSAILPSQSGSVFSNVIIAAAVLSLVIVIIIVAIVIVTIFYYIKTRNNMKIELEE